MSIENNICSLALMSACVVCSGAMTVKDVRRHPDPAFDVHFMKCQDCGLERPLVRERPAVK